MTRSKLIIKSYIIVADLREIVVIKGSRKIAPEENCPPVRVIKVSFKAITGKFISKLLFPVKYDMINSCKIFYIRIFYILYSMIYILYKLWAKSIHDCMNKNLKCWKTRGAQHVSKALLNLSEFFFGGESVGGGGVYLHLEVFLNNSGTRR